jgi:glucose-6-phosphate isomerase
MTQKNTGIHVFINDCVKKYGTVTYNMKGMYAPQGFKSGQSLFITERDFAEARGLAQQKSEYLLSTANSSESGKPDSFLDLRDGGTDTAGKAGKPVMTGWLNYAGETLTHEKFLQDLTQAGDRIARDFSAFVVIGIGGSYTNIEGIINASHPDGTRIPFYFLGQHLSADRYKKIFTELSQMNKKIAVNIISKSGTTTEPALALRLVLDKLITMKKLGAVFATTDPEKGALRETSAARGFNPDEYFTDEIKQHFYIRANIGGRFSVITPVGLLPFAVAGMDLKALLAGYHYAMDSLQTLAADVAAYKYAAYKKGAVNAILSYNVACFREKILGFRQLWPECNGKAGKGLNVMEEFYTSDAHSNGQLIKSGIKNCMEIFHFIQNIEIDFPIPSAEYNNDKLNVVAQGAKNALQLHTINNRFMAALLLDHWKSGVPVIAVTLPHLNPFIIAMQMGVEHYGAVLFGLMLGINPVNQPGVQGYKEIAFRLLGMKGEKLLEESLKELKDLGLAT